MHDHIEQTSELARHSVRLASPETFRLPTTCAEFDVEVLAGHMLHFARLTAHTAGKTLPDDDRLEVAAGWQAEYDEWLDEAIEAWSEADALEGVTGFGGDAMAAENAAGLTVMEFAVHAWDMARTFEETVDVPDDTAQVVLGVVRRLAEPGRQARAFGPPVPVTGSMSAFDQALVDVGTQPESVKPQGPTEVMGWPQNADMASRNPSAASPMGLPGGSSGPSATNATAPSTISPTNR